MLKLGDEVRVARMTAKVLSLTDDDRPARVEFRFDAPLENSSLRWLRFEKGQFVPWQLPAIGEKAVLRPDWPSYGELAGRRAPEE